MAVLLSNMYDKSAKAEPNGKLEAIEYYNSRTKRWPLAIFYKMLDIAGINEYTILNINKSKTNKKKEFFYIFSLDLILPFTQNF